MIDRDAVRREVAAELDPLILARGPCLWNTLDILDLLEDRSIEGDLVECGVMGGGHMLLAKAYGVRAGLPPRRYWLYDTFEGMPRPTEVDIRIDDGTTAAAAWREWWCRVPLEEVQGNFATRGLLDDDVVFVKGMVEDTLARGPLPERIAYLRLDTDFYASTKVELERLYPRLVPGGVLVVDDYGFWAGARKAVDDFFGGPPRFHEIDFTARMLVKA